jgi:DNA-binding response OmpR family regulator
MQPIKCRILFVEDHEDTRDLMALVLEQSNYEVVTAPSIAGALMLVEAGRFDLFVLDSLLIDGTGIELCKRIREIDRSTPILFYSALAYEKDKDEAFSSGAQRYLVKPVSLPLLRQTVAELIGAPCESDNGFGQRRATYKAGERTMTFGVLESNQSLTVSTRPVSGNPRGRLKDTAVVGTRLGLKTKSDRNAA